MKKNALKQFLFVGVLTLMVAVSPRLFAAVIYDNSVNDLTTRFNPGTLEVGDEIGLAGTERYLTRFDFEYWGNFSGPNNFAGVQAEVRFYLNDGPLFNGYATPGTMFYDSGTFSVAPTVIPSQALGRQTLNFLAGVDFPLTGLYIPSSDITWSVQFSGLGAGDTAGVDLYNPPVVGSSVPAYPNPNQDYWQYNGSSWELKNLTNTVNNTLVPMNFAARFFANETAAVPESFPTMTYALLGGLGLLFVRKKMLPAS